MTNPRTTHPRPPLTSAPATSRDVTRAPLPAPGDRGATPREGDGAKASDWATLAARAQEAPAAGTVRGMFFQDLQRAAPGIAMPRERYLAFSNYPLREFLPSAIAAARLAFPRSTASEALVRLGMRAYNVFSTSLSGMAVLGVAARDPRRLMELSAKAYPLTIDPGHVGILESVDGFVHAALRGVWTYPDSYHVGIWRAALESCRVVGTIDVTRHSACDVDFHVRWRDA